MTAITAITAQNTVAVTGVWPIPPEAIVAQVRAVAEDIGVDAVKIGMLGTTATIAAVADALDLVPDAPVVVDPVMVSESGGRLLDEDAHAALVELILSRATVATPNLPEAEALTGRPAGQDAHALARAVHALGPRTVVVTGGHRDEATDVFFDGESTVDIPGTRAPDGAAHGSGCTHSSTLASFLAHGLDPLTAARRAKEVAAEAVANGLRDIGAGAGPVDALGVEERMRALAADSRGTVPGRAGRLT
jgi:hydroxymethylpyrimidine/phosphomethylpyrimidine kinase